MMARVKEVLVRHHIGAIMLAILLLQGLAAVASLLLYPVQEVFIAILNRARRDALTLQAPGSGLPWQVFAAYAIQATLLLGVAYAFARWLYAERGLETEPDREAKSPSQK